MIVQSVDRVFDIVELLSHNTDGLSLTAISHELDLPTSTVHRLLSVLKDRNYIDKKESTNLYHLGLGFVELTSKVLNSLELTTEAKSHLYQLSHQVDQVVFLAIAQEGYVVYIDKYVPYNDYRNYCSLGTRMDMYCTALGKALLIAYSDREIQALYRDRPLKAITEKTIVEVDTLIEEIRMNRTRGYSIDDEENTPGRFCVAAPVYDYRGKIIAAISTSWLLASKEESAKEKNIALIKKTALDISLSMGYLNRS
jgi:IclR family transcriptional regulator, KDG regulon repressor